MPESETIHSGNLMSSNVHSCRKEDEDVDVGINPEDDPSADKPVTFYKFTSETTRSVAIDVSLKKLYHCVELAYKSIATPKWKKFSGMKLMWKDRIRLNNVIWRAWHTQFIHKGRPKFCYFSLPDLEDQHRKLEATIVEGMYWKRRQETVAAEYRRWRFQTWKGMICSRHRKSPKEDLGLKRRDSLDEALFLPLPNMSPFSGLEDDEWNNCFTDNLFSSLNQPYMFPNPKEMAQAGYADFIQPGLIQLQPSVDEIMASMGFEPFTAWTTFNGGPSGSDPILPLTVPEEAVVVDSFQQSYGPATSTGELTTVDYSGPSFNGTLRSLPEAGYAAPAAVNDMEITQPYVPQVVQSAARRMPIAPKKRFHFVSKEMGMCDNDDKCSPSQSTTTTLVLADSSMNPMLYNDGSVVKQVLSMPPVTSVLRPEQDVDVSPLAGAGPGSNKQKPTRKKSVQSKATLSNKTAGRARLTTQAEQCKVPVAAPLRKRCTKLKEPNISNKVDESCHQQSLVNQRSIETCANSSAASSAQTTARRPGGVTHLTDPLRQESAVTTNVVSPITTNAFVLQQKAKDNYAILPQRLLYHQATAAPHCGIVEGTLQPSHAPSNNAQQFTIQQQSFFPYQSGTTGGASLCGLTNLNSLRNTSVVRPVPINLSSPGRNSEGSAFSALSPMSSHSVNSPASSPMSPPKQLPPATTSAYFEVAGSSGSGAVVGAQQPLFASAHLMPAQGYGASASTAVTSGLQPLLIMQQFSSVPMISTSTSVSGSSNTSEPISPVTDSYVQQPFDAHQVLHSSMPESGLKFKTSKEHKGLHKVSTKRPADSTEDPNERKRMQHLQSEHTRRCALKNGFEQLETLLPNLGQEGAKITNALVLMRAGQFIREVTSRIEQTSDEIAELKKNAEQLSAKISACQSNLPSSSTEPKTSNMQLTFTNYVKSKTKANWKFFLLVAFQLAELIKPLFESFHEEVRGQTTEELQQTAVQWSQKFCNLVVLRPALSKLLLDLATETAVLSDAGCLPNYALKKVGAL